MSDCGCYDCTKAYVEATPIRACGGMDFRMARMFLCVTCGNKRCPKAKSHDNDCSGSNEPGQPGSLYPRTPTTPPDGEGR